jgi:hypothetical protein
LLGDKTVQDRAVACDKNIARLQAADVKANLALDRLQQQPDDPAANLIVGRFRCFDKQDWQSGLRFLVRGGDTELQKLAEQELNEPSSPAEQMKLANAWWDFAERTSTKADRLSGQSIRLHAIDWYRQALPNLSGLPLLKAQKRIAQGAPLGTAPPEARH